MIALAIAALVPLLVGLVACTRPPPTVASTATIVPRDAAVRVPGLNHYFLVATRAGFDAIRHATARLDHREIALAFRLYETIPVVNGQRVRVLRIDGDAAELELLEGPHVGRRGWIAAGWVDP